ncbi:hypothetical protein P368_02350 [Comamonas thiooxydans]|nr:hypothetical protein P365_02350 [Comamonas thiooxydans]KGH16185.1 hypothetical protein P368_02350 [Comamonas thiooxydans]
MRLAELGEMRHLFKKALRRRTVDVARPDMATKVKGRELISGAGMHQGCTTQKRRQ